MNPFIAYPICSCFYSILLIYIYLSKKRIKSIDNKIFVLLAFSNFLSLIAELGCYIGVEVYKTNEFQGLFILKNYIITLLLWILIYHVYNMLITNKNYGKKDFDSIKYVKKISKYVSILFVVSSIMIYMIPLEVYNDGIKKYTFGAGVNFLTVIYVVCIFTWVIRFFINFKNIKSKKYVPLIVFIILITIAVLIQSNNREFLLITSVETFVCLLMFHTIENPDLKLINQLELAKDSAEKANHAKTDFLSSMSHEIRTPLNAIVGFSQCIENATNLEEAKEDARDIVMASQNLLEIVNGILDISKIEADKMEIVNTEYNLREILDNLTKLIMPRIAEKDIELKTNFALDLPEVLYGDSGKVKQVITNVLTNAAKYTEKGEINFNVGCINEKDKCRLVITIKDTGRGIKPEQIDKLFNKFQRLDEDKNTTLEGTGLGLAITKRLVEMMGGKIVVSSIYGEGSTFTIYLTQEISNSLYKKEVVEDKVIKYDNKKVLLVDDNKLNIKVGTKILKEYNLDITPCNSGFECINKIENDNKYDIILLDIMMPKMSGVETLKRLKQIEGFDTPVIALTADAIQGRENKYLEVGFNGYLSKPIEDIELRKVLGQFLVQVKKEEVELAPEVKKEKNNMLDVDYLKENNIDIDSSLELLGNIEMYNETLKDFLIENESRIPKMKEHLDNGDTNNYAILSHALKSDSKYLGFKKLAELSLDHELKGKEDNLEYIKDHYEELMNELERIIDIVKKYLGDE